MKTERLRLVLRNKFPGRFYDVHLLNRLYKEANPCTEELDMDEFHKMGALIDQNGGLFKTFNENIEGFGTRFLGAVIQTKSQRSRVKLYSNFFSN